VPRETAPGIDAAFTQFADALIQALQSCGVAAEVGEIAGSCCPGRYDIAVGGKKIIGIAQRRRQGTTGGQKDGQLLAAVLVHAMIWAEGSLNPEIDRLEQFRAEAGQPTRFQRAVMGSLQEISGIAPDALEAALRQSFEAGT
jgi:octanoyl-[GcvH]:protein N-octanoyltransferase